MDSDGANQTRFTAHPKRDVIANWSPDCKEIAWRSERVDHWEIFVMESVDTDGDGNGDNPTNLSQNSALDFSPDWSPDGKGIVFTSNSDGNNEIYLMNADGTNQTRLTNNPSDDSSPGWSPDGSKNAFQFGN